MHASAQTGFSEPSARSNWSQVARAACQVPWALGQPQCVRRFLLQSHPETKSELFPCLPVVPRPEPSPELRPRPRYFSLLPRLLVSRKKSDHQQTLLYRPARVASTASAVPTAWDAAPGLTTSNATNHGHPATSRWSVCSGLTKVERKNKNPPRSSPVSARLLAPFEKNDLW